MNDPTPSLPTEAGTGPPSDGSKSATRLVLVLRAEQRQRWQAGDCVPAEDYLARYPDLRADPEAALDLIFSEFLLRERLGDRPSAAEYRQRFPEYADTLGDQIELHRALQTGATLGSPRSATPGEGVEAGGWPEVPGYEIEGELGRGGMGVVYRARQFQLQRVVALKVILAGGHAGAEERVRFLAEAEAIARVRHPGIVQVFDFGTHQGMPYFTLEFCEGGSLADRLAGAPLPPREAARLVEQVARAVAAAHAQGIVHRDLKPANVLLAHPSVAKITDFGLAKRLDAGGLTRTGAVVGTPSYMAPEQARGESVGPLADVYALGAILYECLTGRPPFKAATPLDTLHQVLTDDPVPPRQLNAQLPADLETVALECLHRDPGRRYASAGALADDLARFLAGESIAARPARWPERAARWARRRPTQAAVAALGLLAALAVAGLGAVAAWQWRVALTALDGEREARRQEQSERERRALAQVQTLLSADPRAVPPILASLAEQRADVLPRLRQVWERPGAEQQRLRAALALLPVEPQRVRGALVEGMLQASDPAELLLIRDALRPHATAALTASLWQRLRAPGATGEQRLRVLAALAAFDPNGAGWDGAAEGVLGTWLDDHPLAVQTWTEALRPAAGRLLGPLIEVFHGRRLPGRRVVAAEVLAVYTADRPDVLAGLTTEADDQSFARLLPGLLRQPRQVAPLLARELARRPEPDWQDAPLDRARRAPGPEVARAIEQAGGLLGERFALVQTLPLGEFDRLAAALGRGGYRPVRFRPDAADATPPGGGAGARRLPAGALPPRRGGRNGSRGGGLDARRAALALGPRAEREPAPRRGQALARPGLPASGRGRLAGKGGRALRRRVGQTGGGGVGPALRGRAGRSPSPRRLGAAEQGRVARPDDAVIPRRRRAAPLQRSLGQGHGTAGRLRHDPGQPNRA
jgi:hypothetical protein